MQLPHSLSAFAFTLTLCCLAHAEDLPVYAPLAPSLEVEVIKLEWQDKSRDRVVPVKLYFPKTGSGPFPVIVFSHGLGGSRDNNPYLGNHWAGCGYVSVHMQHIGSDDSVWKGKPLTDRTKALQGSAANLANILNRPLDGKFVIDELEKLQREIESEI